MPPAIFVLGLAIFAQGTSELMLAGLLPELSSDLGVSIPTAGLLISAFAIGMLVGAPVLAVVTLRWPRRTALLSFLAVFVLAHVAGALTPNYEVLLVTRVVGAFVYAGFWAVASVTVIGIVPSDRRGRAMSILAGGLTVATILGRPLGTVIGQHLGVARGVLGSRGDVDDRHGRGRGDGAGGRSANSVPKIRDEFRAMVNPPLWLAYGTTALSVGALLVIFSYLAPLLVEVTGLTSEWVPAVLALYGVGALVGITIGGRTADARPFKTLYVGLLAVVGCPSYWLCGLRSRSLPLLRSRCSVRLDSRPIRR